jgi:hypothetical protein
MDKMPSEGRMNASTLQNIQLLLDEWGFRTELAPIAVSVPAQQLTVVLDEIDGLPMTIFFLGDLLKATLKDSEITTALDEEETDFLQLFIRFPFEPQENSYADLARLILMINWSTPVGSFGLNEVQKQVYYRKVFESQEGETDPGLVADAVSGMQYYAELRLDLLRTVATGAKTLGQVLSELEAEGRREETFPGYDL